MGTAYGDEFTVIFIRTVRLPDSLKQPFPNPPSVILSLDKKLGDMRPLVPYRNNPDQFFLNKRPIPAKPGQIPILMVAL